jgi:ribosomal protein L11 methyltransferase
MFDIGCGSGILTIAAVKLGVKEALGMDIDPEAVHISDENARVNGISEAASFRVGSIKEILTLNSKSPAAPLVTANVIAHILEDLFTEGMGNLVLPGGKIILSGILQEQLSGIVLRLEKERFEVIDKAEQEDWVGLIAAKGTSD